MPVETDGTRTVAWLRYHREQSNRREDRVAFDPHREDYHRLALRFTRTLENMDPTEAAKAFVNFGRRFAQDRDALPQTDADRAFHLVAEATTLIDYQLPFATDEEAETIISRGHQILDEALSLDPLCFDAVRMEAAGRCATFEEYYTFLLERRDEVKARCSELSAEAQKDVSHERAQVAADLARRPYLRWIAMLASKALICGRNKETLRLCDELLSLDPTDTADARFTAALAYAKLEDEQGLDQLETRCQAIPHLYGSQDAWMLLARLAMAHKRRDFPRARQTLARIVELYPQAVPILARQRELPDGVFARLSAPPYSEDELVIAVSEATVLFQEGRDLLARGTLGSWVLRESLALATSEQRADLQDMISLAESAPGGYGVFGSPNGSNDEGGAR